MNKNKTLLCLCLVFVLVFIFAGCAKEAEPPAAQGKDPREIVLASSETMQKMKSYAYTMNMTMSMPNMMTGIPQEMTMQGSGQTSAEPQKTHLTITVNTGQQEMPMELYAIVEENKIVEYISNPASIEGWLKMEFPLNEEAAQMLNPARALEIMKESMTDAIVVGEEKQGEATISVLEVNLDPEAAGDVLQMFSGSGFPVEDMQALFSSVDSFSYKMWIREDNFYTTKFEMDLGPLFKSLAATQTKAEDKKLLENATAVITVIYTDFDQPVDIEVPEEVTKSALDISELVGQATPAPK